MNESITSGKLRIGDDWHAITIIALSQSNPLKAIAEFVENSIDAGAKQITITRGRQRGAHFLRISDDGEGICCDSDGKPDFRYESNPKISENNAHQENGLPLLLTKETFQPSLFEFPGPLFSVVISPASSVVQIGQSRTFCAICRDRSKRLVEANLSSVWELVEGEGRMENNEGEIITFIASEEPGLTRLRVTVRQGEVECCGEALVTVTDSLIVDKERLGDDSSKRGIPGYTFQNAPGELWRSRYQADQNVVVINNGHRDFLFASRSKALKLRYICRLFAKELVLMNFVGTPSEELLERLIELSLYVEENLR